jgi:hypothetical protein
MAGWYLETPFSIPLVGRIKPNSQDIFALVNQLENEIWKGLQIFESNKISRDFLTYIILLLEFQHHLQVDLL